MGLSDTVHPCKSVLITANVDSSKHLVLCAFSGKDTTITPASSSLEQTEVPKVDFTICHLRDTFSRD